MLSSAVKTFIDGLEKVGGKQSTDLYVKLVAEEVTETINAFELFSKRMEQKDLTELLDGIVDTIWVTIGLSHLYGKEDFSVIDAIPFKRDDEYVEGGEVWSQVKARYQDILLLMRQEGSHELIDSLIRKLWELGLSLRCDMVGAWQELIKSNMSKLNSPVFREDGKLTKNPKTFIEANFKPFTGWYRV